MIRYGIIEKIQLDKTKVYREIIDGNIKKKKGRNEDFTSTLFIVILLQTLQYLKYIIQEEGFTPTPMDGFFRFFDNKNYQYTAYRSFTFLKSNRMRNNGIKYYLTS